jgi:hypothetical protein
MTHLPDSAAIEGFGIDFESCILLNLTPVASEKKKIETLDFCGAKATRNVMRTVPLI